MSWVFALAIGGCASRGGGEAPNLPPPAVRLGPPIEVLTFDYGSLRAMHATSGPDGRVHVLVALSGQEVVQDLVVREDGSVEGHVIGPASFGYQFIDAALDSTGRLHVLIDNGHWILENDGWRKSEAMPWIAAGLAPRDVGFAHFVAGAPSLTWCFQIEGEKVAAPGRWDWYGFGIQGAGGVIFPWHSHGERSVLVTETSEGYGPWVVLEPKGDHDTTAANVASDRQGNVSVLYFRSRPGLIARGMPELRFARIPVEVLRGVGPTTSSTASGDSGALHLVPIERGLDIEKIFRATDGFVPVGHPYYPMGVAPEGETALIFPSYTAHGGEIAGSSQLAPQMRLDGQYAYAWASGDTFHVLGVQMTSLMGMGRSVRYAQYSGGRWSAPIELDTIEYHIPFPRGLTWPAIVALGNGTAVAVWPQKDAIVARWIRPGE